MDTVKEYPNGEITVVWKPELCQHAGVCVKLLPKVYNPKEKPWIKVENAATDELKHQISKCPSGALSYR
ncbi:(4Fe-4S)-binding protein [Flagellimonas taeanensis]|uniref:(4Fe-4S)-binding protein n=1 Tax=Flavobacteriaceae TaxID=49546 RepID=UPI000E697D80|nr:MULTISPECIES: (4Fe-4S)-binding protein [Allomuricauda]MDC6384786.1 (4Fe-4S)-binding protein [Muricauda sp. SK9]RIV53480.1 (4Fe-4S)-binding protein [Allomuricauda taeanensis]